MVKVVTPILNMIILGIIIAYGIKPIKNKFQSKLKMLTADEVLRIQSPIILVMIAGEYSAILYVPDISKMHFNKLNGMGTKEENKKLRIKREMERPIREIQKVKIWNIWDQIKNMDEEDFDERQELRELRENWRVSRKRKDNDE